MVSFCHSLFCQRKLALQEALNKCALAMLGLVAVVGVVSADVTDQADKIDFNFHIKPLLSDRCYACHGPDATSRQADLRLDSKEGAFKTIEGGRRILVAARPDQSELFRRITAEDPEERMPPADSSRSLSPDEIDLIGRWIEQGAEWKPHWSFIPVGEVAIPEVKEDAWPHNQLDRFVLARLEREGLRPQHETGKERLFRRASLDLRGLSPNVEEIEAFLADDSPDAYERAVDRLLASPAYGERMAIDWLDVARFADTYGYQSDRYNHLWPWRDWVIRTFNRNLPYDQFIIWQIAGDLLPDTTSEQILATAFNRNHRQTNEGGSINEEFRVEYNADRVKTTAMAFLGLTMECARCHEHKFDSISQQDYYRFFAFFNSTDESGLYAHWTDAIPCPTLLLYRGDEEKRHQALKDRIELKVQQVEDVRREAGSEFQRWLRQEMKLPNLSGLVGQYSFDKVENDEILNDNNSELPGKLIESPQSVEGRFGKALLFSGENSVTFEKVADFKRTDPFSFSLWLWIPEEKQKIVLLHRTRAGADAGSRGYELLLEDGHASFGIIHFWPGNCIKVTTREKLELRAWLHVGVTYDGSSRAGGIRLYVDGHEVAIDVGRDRLFKDIVYTNDSELPLRLAARERGPGFKNGMVDELKVYNRSLSPIEMAEAHQSGTLRDLRAGTLRDLRAGNLGTSAEKSALYEYYLKNFHEPYAALLSELKELREKENDLINQVPEVMVMGDLPQPRPTYVLKRGAYDAPGELVEPGTPPSILEFDSRLPKNRLGLAKWLVDRQNPLTARVAVNRYWQLFFGRGIVATPEDFGSQGELPSHPALLDWLSKSFMDHEWNLKALHKLIVTSATYRQSSAATPETVASDPQNIVLGRGPSQRLSAELIRDNALSASGLLDYAIGGPSVKTKEPAGHTVPSATDTKDQREKPGGYRRSLYIYIKRSVTSPYLLTFDATSREDCIARRQVTNTPLQALLLMNDRLFHEIAQTMAARTLREGGESLEERIVFAFRSLTGRRPFPRELEILAKLHQQQLTLFQNDPENAKVLFATGGPRNYHTLDSVERARYAATVVLAKAILNFDETITKR